MEGKVVKLKAKIVFEWEYEANPKDYLISERSIKDLTMEDIIEIDEEGAKEDIGLFTSMCKNEPTVEIVEVKENVGD